MDNHYPERYLDVSQALERFGDRVRELGESLNRVDHLADSVIACFADHVGFSQGWRMFEQATDQGLASLKDAPTSLIDLFETAEQIPPWVNPDALNRGGEPLIRSTAFGALTLGLKSLVLGYCSPGGNKPLVFSGRLQQQALKRLYETAKFVYEVSAPDGLQRGSAGYGIVLRVRLVHAQVRRLILRSGKWRAYLWGAPLNQHDMLATALLFSIALLDGLKQFGFRFSAEQREDQLHLWRYIGYLLGLDPSFFPTTTADARRDAEIIAATQGPPDDDSKELVKALLNAPVNGAKTDKERRRARRKIPIAEGLCRKLIGDTLADQVAIPRRTDLFVPTFRQINRVRQWWHHATPKGRDKALKKGMDRWHWFLNRSLTGDSVSYALPSDLDQPDRRSQ
ncbi:MAG: oxygenase MpaB family protein [Myxococcota bacterium]|nr:oxygenase MpaB family protein [Myxococcota bacterium]